MIKLFNGGFNTLNRRTSFGYCYTRLNFSTRYVFKDSIYALSTGFGKSAIAVSLILPLTFYRLSESAVIQLLKHSNSQSPNPINKA